jgi:hypothetical protein
MNIRRFRIPFSYPTLLVILAGPFFLWACYDVAKGILPLHLIVLWWAGGMVGGWLALTYVVVPLSARQDQLLDRQIRWLGRKLNKLFGLP